MNNTCIIRTNKIYGGGSAYEHHVFQAISKYYNTALWLNNDQLHRYIKYSKLRILIQTIMEHPKYADYLITNKLFIYGLRLNRFKKKILILHHIDQDYTNSKYINNYIEKKILKSLYKFDAIVTVSNYWKNEIETYTEKPVYLIRNSFDIDLIEKSIRDFSSEKFKRKYGLPEQQPIIYCGNSTFAKGIDIVKKNIDRNKYFVVTSGQKKIDIGQLHLDLSYPEYLKLLNVSDCTVLLSRLKEGWNRIAHESILCGTPVIGKNIAGLGELLEISSQIKLEDDNDLDQIIENVLHNQKIVDKGRMILKNYNLC